MSIVEYLSIHYKSLCNLSEIERTEWLELLNILTHGELDTLRSILATDNETMSRTICIQKIEELLLSNISYDNTFLMCSQDELLEALYEAVIMEYLIYFKSLYNDKDIDLGWKLIVNKDADKFDFYFSTRFIPTINTILKVMEESNYTTTTMGQFEEWDNHIQQQYKELWAGGAEDNDFITTLKAAWDIFLFAAQYYLPPQYANLEERVKLKMMCQKNPALLSFIEQFGLESNNEVPF